MELDNDNVTSYGAKEIAKTALWSKALILISFFFSVAAITCEYLPDTPGRSGREAYQEGYYKGEAEALKHCMRTHHDD